ncbi:hypothetical protein HHK36_017123 [Tetracentron sinense]|uniref:Choline kinase n=1 Tax=Tetracentron sinense TaxID=13715 RepID=A0A834Z793_TETSI|nr:hypothetical protein HHK36_017123 [Tetracentron sinense]
MSPSILLVDIESDVTLSSCWLIFKAMSPSILSVDIQGDVTLPSCWLTFKAMSPSILSVDIEGDVTLPSCWLTFKAMSPSILSVDIEGDVTLYLITKDSSIIVGDSSSTIIISASILFQLPISLYKKRIFSSLSSARYHLRRDQSSGEAQIYDDRSPQHRLCDRTCAASFPGSPAAAVAILRQPRSELSVGFRFRIEICLSKIKGFHIKSSRNFDLLKKLSPIYVWRSGGSFIMGVNNREGRLPGEAKRILQSLASSWNDVIDSNALQVIPLKGAMTNEVYQIKWLTRTEELSRKVLVRIYGEGVEIFFDRDNEIRTFEFMSKHGQGPRLLGRFPNGRIEEFIHARTLSAPDLCDPEISALIASKLWDFHDLDMPGPRNVLLWDRLRNWLSAAKSLSSLEEAKSFLLDTMEEEIFILEKKLSGDYQRIAFCHNDLQYGNIMFDEQTRSITIIDYDYASYNPVAYDIANHFCEMVADYHTETPHILDFNKYPGNQVGDVEVEQLVQDVEKYTLASHLLWGLWGIISAHVNEIDFDYMEYARQRFQQYWLMKSALLGSSFGAPPDDSDGCRVLCS